MTLPWRRRRRRSQDELFPCGRGHGEALDPVFAGQAEAIYNWFGSLSLVQQRVVVDGLVQRCSPALHAHVARIVQSLVRRDFIGCLPPELGAHILSFVDDEWTLCQAALVSRRWRTAASDRHLWRALCERRGWFPAAAEVRMAARTVDQAYDEAWWGINESPGDALAARATSDTALASTDWRRLFQREFVRLRRTRANWLRGRLRHTVLTSVEPAVRRGHSHHGRDGRRPDRVGHGAERVPGAPDGPYGWCDVRRFQQ